MGLLLFYLCCTSGSSYAGSLPVIKMTQRLYINLGCLNQVRLFEIIFAIAIK